MIIGFADGPRGAYANFLSLLLILIFSAMAASAQVFPPAGGISNSIASTENITLQNGMIHNGTIQILGIDAASFPKIKANLFIDKFCAQTGKLRQEDFSVAEGGRSLAIDSLYFTGNASGEKLDFAVIFDDTGSMGGEIAALKSRVKELTGSLDDSGINATYSLVSFKDSVTVKTEWTGDAELFERKVNSLQPKGGDDEPEASLDAIAEVLAMEGREDAQSIILVITDAHSHYRDDGSSNSRFTKEDIKEGLKESGDILILVSPQFEGPSEYLDMRELADDAQGIWIDINSAEFSVILDRIEGMLTGTYVMEYTSPDETPGENRTVSISVDRRECARGSDTSYYTSPGSWAASMGTNSILRRVLELSISGRVYWDSNGNGFLGSHEEGLEGWRVRLLNGPDGYSTTTITDGEGYYSFTGLSPGNYSVAAVEQSGWSATAPKGEAQRVELTGGHRAEVDFGFKPR